MVVDGWALWSVAIKFLGLLAMAGVVGGSFVHLLASRLQFAELSRLRVYLLTSTTAGFLTLLLGFLLQVGGINHTGTGGMFDSELSAILLSSSLGQVLALRLLGFALMPAAVMLLTVSTRKLYRKQAGYFLCAVSTLLLVSSFALTGHTAELFIATKMLLVLHVLAVLLWIGALYPLLYLSSSSDLAKVRKLMQGFGALAVCIVAVLLLAGIYLAAQLLQTPEDLLTTSYGNTLLLKLFGVAALLLLAAINKLLLVPRLLEQGVKSLQLSIRFEIAVALFVVAVTSWLTTVTGPAGA